MVAGVSNTARFLSIIERLLGELDRARDEGRDQGRMAELRQEIAGLKMTVKDAEKYIHQYQSHIGKLEKQLRDK